VLGLLRAPAEREGTQDGAGDERRQCRLGIDCRDGGRDRGPVPRGPSQGRARPAEVVRACRPHADQEDQAQLGVLRRAQRDRHRGHLARLAAGALGLEQREQVDPQQVADLVGAGAEQGCAVVLPRQDRERDDVHPCQGMGSGRRDGELGR
jgi:hypothetical protein